MAITLSSGGTWDNFHPVAHHAAASDSSSTRPEARDQHGDGERVAAPRWHQPVAESLIAAAYASLRCSKLR